MDMRVHLREEMERNTNVKLMFNTDPGEILKRDDGTLVVTDRDANEVMCNAVMNATGHRGKMDSQNLHDPAMGVRTTRTGNFVPVDDYSRTNVPSMYAVGDVTNRMALTPVALMEGHRLADNLFRGKERRVDHEYVASTVFTTPEIGTVGYTEEEAVKKSATSTCTGIGSGR